MNDLFIDFIYIQDPQVKSLQPYKTSKTLPAASTWEDLRRETGPFFLRALRREWPAYAWPGGYPLYYITEDSGVLCPGCANKNLHLTLKGDAQWKITAAEINYEDEALTCDNCYTTIKPAYEPEMPEDDQEEV